MKKQERESIERNSEVEALKSMSSEQLFDAATRELVEGRTYGSNSAVSEIYYAHSTALSGLAVYKLLAESRLPDNQQEPRVAHIPLDSMPD